MTTALSDLAALYIERNRIKSSLCDVEMELFRAKLPSMQGALKHEKDDLNAQLEDIAAKIAAIEDEQQGNLFGEV